MFYLLKGDYKPQPPIPRSMLLDACILWAQSCKAHELGSQGVDLGLGFGVWGLGVWGLGFGVWGLGVWGLGVWGLGVWGLGFGVWGLGVWGSGVWGLGVWGLGLGVWGLGFGVRRLGCCFLKICSP